MLVLVLFFSFMIDCLSFVRQHSLTLILLWHVLHNIAVLNTRIFWCVVVQVVLCHACQPCRHFLDTCDHEHHRFWRPTWSAATWW
jgi:hypothetical protein